MHQAGILDEVRERVTRRRGGVAVFDRIDPRRTAHIVVDLQNGFMAPGQVLETPMARAIVANVNRIAALRAAGGIVVYTQHTADAEAVRTWPVYFDHFCANRARMIEAFTPGNPGPRALAGAGGGERGLLVIKRRFGAFVPGLSDLHALLQERGFDAHHLRHAFAVCCEATARDAMMMNYKVFFITDANATLTGGTLSAMAHAFCDLRDTQSVLGLIARA
jgi:ureidoacrylate peracid hydrolase